MEIELLKTDSRKYPVADFLSKISQKAHVKILKNLELISTHSLSHLNYSQIFEKIETYKEYKLYEFKTAYNKMQYRILCCLRNEKIYLVHGFIKKTQKIPTKEISTAIQRIKLYIPNKL